MSTDLSKERWAVARYSTKRFGLGCAGDEAFMFLQTIYQDAHEQEMKDVARLIAAAPELLEALKLALKALDAIGDEMSVGDRYTNAGQYLIDSLGPARAAIAKATGEQQ